MRRKLTIYMFLVMFSFGANAQTKIMMQKEGGVYTVPCKVNGLQLKFIFDTGASNVTISLTEAMFMIKNGYLSNDDIYGSSYAQLANGDITENTEILLREIAIDDLKLYNVRASIVHELAAPLLLGQTAISKLGKIQLDGAELIVLNKGVKSYDYKEYSNTRTVSNTYQEYVITRYKTKLMKTPRDVLEKEDDEIIVPYQQKLELLGVENGFFKVRYSGIIGYLNTSVAEKYY